MLKIYEGSLNVSSILKEWYEEQSESNYGAFIPFVGTVRDESNIDGLSFDIYAPMLEMWFNTWQENAAKEGAVLKMAHSQGDVLLHESSYIAAVFSPKRRVALEMIDAFVEDFKASAPIWKYDLIQGQRVYAKDRSSAIVGSGLLSKAKE